MTLPILDLLIVLGYLALSLGVGIWLSRRASGGLRSYFLGGNGLPWYALGLSNASGMFDVAGTMWLVYLLFVYGLKSVFIPWLWPTFNQIFLMMFLAAWLRRSGVLTGAEWITFRFGESRGAKLSHGVTVVFALVTVLGYLAYGFLGIGKLAAEFLPFTFSADAAMNEKVYAVIIVAFTALYVVKGGFMSVVATEVMQFGVMVVACIGVAAVAMSSVTPAQVAAAVPAGWERLGLGWELGLDWSRLLPVANERIATDGFSLFGVFFTMVLLKGILQSLAGPPPNYDMQRILATKSPREAALMSGVVTVVLLFPRYLMVAGLAVLALVHFSDDLRAAGSAADFEAALPFALANFIPSGLLGLVLAGLIAAFMSSYAAALNAAPAYLVNDLYKRYVRPDAPERHYVRLSYASSIAFVVLGTLLGLFLQSINGIVVWITVGLFGGYTAANILKWYWWRLNGYGYFAGMAVGTGFALLLGLPADGNWLLTAVDALYNGALGLGVERVDALNSYPVLFGLAVLASIAVSLLTPADDLGTLKEFYRKTRPWGAWGPVITAMRASGESVEPNRDAARDLFNVAVGIVWQTSFIAMPIFLVLRDWERFALGLGTAAATSLILKVTWYDRLERASRETVDAR